MLQGSVGIYRQDTRRAGGEVGAEAGRTYDKDTAGEDADENYLPARCNDSLVGGPREKGVEGTGGTF